MELGLDGRVALVTGASRGIGLGIAHELAADGARVAISSRSPERIGSAAAEIGARPFVHESADLDAAPQLLDRVEEELGPVEILVTNTGGPPAGGPLGLPLHGWEATYRDLVLGPMALIEHAAPGMRERGFGRILNVASSAVREPMPNLVLSNAHRSAMLSAFKTLARELIAHGVTLNTLLPGRIATDRLAELFGSHPEGQVGELLREHERPAPARSTALRSPRSPAGSGRGRPGSARAARTGRTAAARPVDRASADRCAAAGSGAAARAGNRRGSSARAS
jgi:3-oxoacyl-[acyl-carrier protein] reductase